VLKRSFWEAWTAGGWHFAWAAGGVSVWRRMGFLGWSGGRGGKEKRQMFGLS